MWPVRRRNPTRQKPLTRDAEDPPCGVRLREAFEEDFLTISNLLSVSRVLLLPPVVWLTVRYVETPTVPLLVALLVLALLATLTDFFDGFLARRLHQETIVGRYLDPVCDKIVILGAFTLLVLYFDFPLWVFALYILREIIGVWLGTFLYFRRNHQGRPNLFGKIGVGLASAVTAWYYAVPCLRTRLHEGDPLLDPMPAVWAFLVVQGMGAVAYFRSYGKIVIAKNETAR